MLTDILKIFGTIAKSLFKKSACAMYPLKPAKCYKETRGHIEIESDKCILCTLCAKRCPTGAIMVDRDAHTWSIDHFKCILCNNCTYACPPQCLHMVNQYAAPATDRKPKLYTIKIVTTK